MALFGRADGGPECSTNALDFVLFIFCVAIHCLGYWVLEIPRLFTRPPPQSSDGGRLLLFGKAVSWNCGRWLAPSYFAIIAMGRSRDQKKWLGLYYFGYDPAFAPEDDRPLKLSISQWTKIIAMDMVAIIIHPILIYRAVVLGSQEFPEPLMIGFWLLFSLPPGIIGLYLIIIAAWSRPLQPTRVVQIGFITLLLLGAAFSAAPLVKMVKTAGGWYILSVAVLWALVALPTQLVSRSHWQLHLLFYLLAIIARAGPLLTQILGGDEFYALCGKDTKAFAIAYGFVGGVFIYALSPYRGELTEQYRRPKGWPWNAGTDNDAEQDEESMALRAENPIQADIDRWPVVEGQKSQV